MQTYKQANEKLYQILGNNVKLKPIWYGIFLPLKGWRCIYARTTDLKSYKRLWNEIWHKYFDLKNYYFSSKFVSHNLLSQQWKSGEIFFVFHYMEYLIFAETQ